MQNFFARNVLKKNAKYATLRYTRFLRKDSMGIRGELYTTKVDLDNRSYFFNVKENRTGDVFLQVVESKSHNGEDFDRHAIVIFADDMQKFFQGLDASLHFIEKDRKERAKARAEKKALKEAKYGHGTAETGKKVYRKKSSTAENERQPDGIPRTGRIHVVSKRTTSNSENV